MTYTLTDNSQMLAPEDWPTEDRAHRRAIGHPLWRATDWTIYDDRGRPVRTRLWLHALWLHAESLWLRDIADDDRDAAVERAEKAETEVRDAPPRPLDPTNPDDLRAVEVFLGWYVTNYDTVLLLPLRQREVAFEAIQETRRHLDMTADWVAREALRARKIDAIAESTAGGTTLHRRDDLAERAWLPRITDHTHHCKEARA